MTAAKARNRAAEVDLLAVARREVREETGLEPDGPFQPLGGVKAHGHKLIFAWAVEHDCDAAAITSNSFSMEWPPRTGRTAEFPEVDRAACSASRRLGRRSCRPSAGSSTTSRSSRPPALA